jgi:hypothetical protein
MPCIVSVSSIKSLWRMRGKQTPQKEDATMQKRNTESHWRNDIWNVSCGKLELEVHSLFIGSVRDDGGPLKVRYQSRKWLVKCPLISGFYTRWEISAVDSGYWQTGPATSQLYGYHWEFQTNLLKVSMHIKMCACVRVCACVCVWV